MVGKGHLVHSPLAKAVGIVTGHIETQASAASFSGVANQEREQAECARGHCCCEECAMVFHMVVLGKLQLLAGGGHGHWKLLLSLLCPFALKLPFAATCLPSSGVADLLLALRLLVFRLARIFLDEAAAAQGGRGRWERALRLLHERVGAVAGSDAARLGVPRTSEETFNVISMLAL
ncbi:hypothetical protein B296_00041451 [Ensete ventricosum]|uniref:Uncharacterized protein n=1 Tax=Ensete ventricosum TaxID=4639 RepID=A0A426ZLS6_ENSVE|nr:hypothetical protein B296_00041451 [Ensete ventricosum]